MLFIYFRVITNRKCFHAIFTGFGEHDNVHSLVVVFFRSSFFSVAQFNSEFATEEKNINFFSARRTKKKANICTQIKWNETKTSEGCLRINI